MRNDLQIFDTLEQGTPEWLQARAGVITASTIGQLITPKLKVSEAVTAKNLLETLVAERLSGWVEPTICSKDMQRGNLDEPLARDAYAKHTLSKVEQIGFMLRDFGAFKLGYSPDGLVGDKGLIEIKSRRPKVQVHTIYLDEVPAYNMAQIQCGLLVSGREWCDYVSFCGGMKLYIKRVYPMPEWQDVLLKAGLWAEQFMQVMEKDYLTHSAKLPDTERPLHYLPENEWD